MNNLFNHKICIIGVYFGTLPAYFPLWLKSCERNKEIDFLIYTDQKLDSLPNNVFVKELTLNDFSMLATEKIGMCISLDKPYKCCDFKPAYGVIFENDIENYDFWGHCDFDLIFGDLVSFLSKYELDKYDKFLTLGHLCLYRNTVEVNNRFRLPGSVTNYKEVFTSNSSFAFDELSGMARIYQKNGFKMFSKRIFVDISTMFERYRMIDIYPLDKKAKNYKRQTFCWESGKVFHEFELNSKVLRDEYMYIHFQKRPNYQIDDQLLSADAFYITNKGFFPKTQVSSTQTLVKMNQYKVITELFEECSRYTNSFMHKIRVMGFKVKLCLRGKENDN